MVKRKIKKHKYKEIREKIKTYIPGFDKLFSHGIPKGSSVLIEGGPGVGKTIFCLQIAWEAIKRGKKVLYMSFEEPEKHLISHMKSFGWNPDTYIKKGSLIIRRFNALDVSRSVEALLSEAKKELLIEIQPVFFPENFNPDIVLIDSLTSIASAFTGEEARFRIYMEQLFRYLEKTDTTSFLIREVANPTHVGVTSYVERGEAISFLSDGIIVLYNVIYNNGMRESAIEVLKMRGEKIYRKIVKMDITNKGLKVYPNKVLRGIHRRNYYLT
ncbi:MAG: AAA family ATPase [Candidatus Aenigmarchaeota archaeon]|nr:AAA family ATPase [Candidatus Aenigmarchaeota archaeon]